MPNIELTLILPDGRAQSVTLPDDVIVGRLITALTTRLNLPTLTEDGDTIIYTLDALESLQLDEETTLAEAGVLPQTELYLLPDTQGWDIDRPPRPSQAAADVPRTLPIEPAVSSHQNRGLTWLFSLGFLLGLLAVIFGLQVFGRAVARDAELLPTSAVTITPTVTPEPIFKVQNPSISAGWLYFYRQEVDGYWLYRASLYALDSEFTPEPIGKVSGTELVTFPPPRQIGNSVYFQSHVTNRALRELRRDGTITIGGYDDPPGLSIPYQVRHGRVYASAAEQEINIADRVDFQGERFGPLVRASSRIDSGIDLGVLVAHDWDQHVATVDDVLYFAGNDGTNGVELWQTNGNPKDTFMVAELNRGPESSYPAHFTEYSDMAIFHTLFNRDLWLVDRANGNRTLIAEDAYVPAGSQSSSTIIDDNIYYIIQGNELSRADILAVYNPTTGELSRFQFEGTLRLKELYPTPRGPILLANDTQIWRFNLMEETFERIITDAPIESVLPYIGGHFLLVTADSTLMTLSANATQAELVAP